MRRILYGRVSLEEQAEQFGLASQFRAMREFSLAKGYDDCVEMSDEGYLGSDLDRPALTKIRALAREGQLDVLIAHDPDRLSRKRAHQFILQEEFERAGVRLEFVTTPAADTPEAKMLLDIKGMFAEYEREKIRERTLRGRREKAHQGYIVGGRILFGYRYLGKAEGERGKLVIDEPRAEIVRQIFEWAAEGISIRKIAARLNEMGIAPSLASRWGKSSVARVLANRTYIGEAHYNRRKRCQPRNPDAGHATRRNKYTLLKDRPAAEWISIPTPAIVNIALFDRVAETLRRNKEDGAGRPTRRYLLRGLVRCGKCGRRMNGDPCHGSPCYRCAGREHAERCQSRANAQRLDAAVWKAVSEPFLDPARLRAIVECNRASLCKRQSQAKASSLRKQVEQLQAREARAVRALLDAGLADHHALVRKDLAETAARRRRVERELADAQPAVAVAIDRIGEICRAVSGVIVELAPEERQQFLRRIVEGITVSGSDVVIRCRISASMAQNCPQRADVVANSEQDISYTVKTRLAA